MKKDGITKFKLDPKNPPKADWRAFDRMTDAEALAAARDDPDCPPATTAQLARASRMPNVRALRERLQLTQAEFATRFGLSLGTVRDWEQGTHIPDRAARVLLAVIEREPDAVARVVAAE